VVRDDLPRGTVTFVFTDVEGSTRLLEELGAEAYADALAEHRRVIREACAAHGGVEVDTQGDALFFAFATAPGALEAARARDRGRAAVAPLGGSRRHRAASEERIRRVAGDDFELAVAAGRELSLDDAVELTLVSLD
jgi:class 3 adenylate cyclase